MPDNNTSPFPQSSDSTPPPSPPNPEHDLDQKVQMPQSKPQMQQPTSPLSSPLSPSAETPTQARPNQPSSVPQPPQPQRQQNQQNISTPPRPVPNLQQQSKSVPTQPASNIPQQPSVSPQQTRQQQTFTQPTSAQPVNTSQEKIITGAPSRSGDKPEPVRPSNSTQPLNSAPSAQTEQEQTGQIQQTARTETTIKQTPKKTGSDPQPPVDKKPDGTPLDGEEKIFSAVGYVGILALLPLLARRDSDFCQHHGRQGLILAIIFIFLWMFAKISSTFWILILLLQIVAIVAGFLLAYKGDWFRIPGIYDLSLKLKFSQKPPPPPPPPQN